MSQRSGQAKRIAEIAAAVGVILSLVFVGVEIRQNTAAVRAQTRQQLTDSSSEFLLSLATTDLGELWGRFIRGDSLTFGERYRIGAGLIAAVRNIENVYLQTQEGVIDESALLSYGWRGSIVYGSDSFAEWWQTNSDRFHPDFVVAFEMEYELRP